MRNIAIFLCLLFAITACGGGSGSSSEPEVVMTTPDAMLGVVLTDAPSDDIEQLLVTITKIELVGQEQTFTVFKGEERVDFAQLTDFLELFNITSVAPDIYSAVRIEMRDVTIVAEDASGVLVETTVALPSNIIEIAPQEPFTVAQGQVMFLKIDFDIDKALAMLAEDGSELVLQPVIFVEFGEQLSANRFVRLRGIVEQTYADGARICDTQLISEVDTKRRALGACADIKVDLQTGFFGTDVLPLSYMEMVEGDEVMVVGYINRRVTEIPAIPYGHFPPPGECRLWYPARSTGDQPPPAKCESFDTASIPEGAVLLNDQGLPVEDIYGVDALVIEHGQPTDFPRLRGRTASAAVADQFDFVAEGEAWGDLALTAQLFPQSRIFSRDGEELGPEAIQPEIKAKLDGVIVETPEGPLLRSAFMVARVDEVSPLRLSGILLSATRDALNLATDSGDRCVNVAGADIFLVSLVDGRMVSEQVTADVLPIDAAVEAFGTEGVDGCFSAQTVIAQGN